MTSAEEIGPLKATPATKTPEPVPARRAVWAFVLMILNAVASIFRRRRATKDDPFYTGVEDDR